MTHPPDLTGLQFGRLTVKERTESDPVSGKARWRCLCNCGREVVLRGNSLQTGNTRSCGCFRRERTAEERTTHGLSHHPLYEVWQGMIARCNNPNGYNYDNYGGRGIKVCERWRSSFESFLSDLGERPPDPPGWESQKPYYTLDRTDNEGDYEPGNVRWATATAQGNNRRGNVTEAEVQRMIELYGQGLSCQVVGQQVGRSSYTVQVKLRAAGVALRPRPGWVYAK